MNLKESSGFTITEVLVVIVIIGLIFSVLSIVFYSTTNNSIFMIGQAENIKREAVVLWDIQRKILSSRELFLEKDRLHMITTAGDFYEGVVKCSYIFKEGSLFYYEFPYPYGDIRFFDEKMLVNIGNFEDFQIRAVKNDKSYEEFKGNPDYFLIVLKNRRFIVKNEI